MAITLTEKAAKHVTRYMERRGKGIGLRFGVRTTGCSGMAYKLEYVDEVGDLGSSCNHGSRKHGDCSSRYPTPSNKISTLHPSCKH